MPRADARRLEILTAMATRRAPLIKGAWWFVPGWTPAVTARDVRALKSAGLIEQIDRHGRIFDLTDDGRAAVAAKIATGRAAA